MQQARRAWRHHPFLLDLDRLVFIDETWTTTNMARGYGRASRGQRCVAAVPQGLWQTTTFVGALRQRELVAPMVADGPMDGEMFRAYVDQCLVPVLRSGDIVILDNLSSHKVRGVREVIVAAGATLLYLPPYSPDLNPIEKFFAKLKALLRKAAARSVETLWSEVGALLATVTQEECSNYLASCGYVNT